MGARKKNPNAVALGSKGGKARAKRLSADELSAIGKKGAEERLQAEEQQEQIRAQIGHIEGFRPCLPHPVR